MHTILVRFDVLRLLKISKIDGKGNIYIAKRLFESRRIFALSLAHNTFEERPSMVKMSLEMSSELNWALKQYCLKTYRDQVFGKQQGVVRQALREYLSRHDHYQYKEDEAA